MSVVIWQDKVKIVTGEISRASFFALARDVNQMSEAIKTEDVDALRMINDFAIIHATRLVFTKQGEDWVQVGAEGSFEHLGAEYQIRMPVTHELLDQLPATLAIRWAEAAQNDNAELLSGVFFGSGRTKKRKA